MRKKEAPATGANIQFTAKPVPGPARVRGQSYTSRWHWLLVLASLVVGVVLGLAGARLMFDDEIAQELDHAKSQSQLDLARVHMELVQAHARLDAVQAQMVIEQSTRKGLEATLQATQTELGRARDQLAFFDQLLPPGPKGTVSIRAFDIERQGPNLLYKLLLMRNGADDTQFKGLLKFVATGTQDGKKTKIELQAASIVPAPPATPPVPDVNGFVLSFDQFQRSSGLLSVPEGFVPLTVTLNVLEGNALRISRTVNLPAAD